MNLSKAFGFSLGFQLLRIVITLGTSIVAARSLGGDGFGEYLVLLSISSAAGILATLGLNREVTNQVAIGRSADVLYSATMHAAVRNFLPVAPVCFAVLLGASTVLNGWRLSAIGSALSLTASALVVGITVAWAEIARTSHREVWASILQGVSGGSIAGAIGLAGSAGCAVLFPTSVDAFVIAIAIGQVVAAVVFASTTKLLGRAARDAELSESLRLDARSSGIAQLAAVVGSDAPLWMVGLLLGPGPAGVYGLARRLTSQIGLVPHILALSVAPTAATAIAAHDQARGRRLAAVAILPATTLTLVSSIALAVLASPIQRLIGVPGPDFRSVLIALSIPIIAQTFCGLPSYMLQVSGGSDFCARVESIAALFTLIGVVVVALSTNSLIATSLASVIAWIGAPFVQRNELTERSGYDASVLALLRLPHATL